MPGIRVARELLRRSWDDLLAFAFPTACAACGRALERAAALCDPCDARLNELRRLPACRRCASPLPDLDGPCGRCHGKGIRPLNAIARLSTFESTTRDLVHAIKYGRRWPVVDVVAGWLLEQPPVRAILADADVLVPVPLHWSRRFGRGFNQAELLARALARPSGLGVACALKRTRRTRSQTAFHSRAARQRNLEEAFVLARPGLVQRRRVVLIDDVMTSGATLQAVARAVLKGGRPLSISAIVIGTANPLKSDLVAV